MTATPDSVDEQVRALQVQQRVLESRLGAAERAVARLWVAAVAGLLVVGQLWPFLTYRQDGEEVSPSLLTFGFGGLTYVDQDGRRETFDVVLGIAFVGLSLLALLAVVSLAGLVRRRDGLSPERQPSGLRTPLAVLLVIGLLGAWATVLLALGRGSGRSEVQVHAGLPLFTVGALLFTWLVVSDAGRDLWRP